ncbi:MAG: mandelate racemase/muconate lactonizing enzyme family protein [Bryobacterales bacterium]|nr:mandelate racemase/muconate lactonizing enzyme family protein [Bryobacterales bacterium]
MRITRLSTAVVEANYDWVLVRVDADNGQHGIGEAYMGPGVPAILRDFATIVVGADPEGPQVLVRRLRAASIHAAPGAVDHAIAGIETAVWDLLGKTYGQPVWKLLGGRFRQNVRIYADCHAGDALDSLSSLLQPRSVAWMGGETQRKGEISLKHHGWNPEERDFPGPADYKRRARQMADRGFTALKFDADIPTPFATDEYNRALSRHEIEYVYARLAAVREEIGPAVDLAVDCHWNYTVADAARLAKALESLDLLWLEDPIPPRPIEPLGHLQAAVSVPISTGENLYAVEDFWDLLTIGRVRVIAPDVQKTGLLRAMLVAQMADLRFVNVAIHNIASPIGFIAAAHAAAAIPNFLALEWHGASVPFFDELAGGPVIENGHVRLTDKPGLGIELNTECAWRYRKAGEPFFD